MKIKNVMTRRVIKLKAEQTLRQAAKTFLKKKISGAPVVDKKGKIIGILSEKDIFKALHPSYQEFFDFPEDFKDFEKLETLAIKRLDKYQVKDIMQKKVIIADPDDPILSVGSLMLANNFNRVPVAKNGKIVGLVSRREIYHNIFKKLKL